ncbi:MAG: hypothetical protein SGPRY_003166 [Prymnesium sp.]
MSVFNGAGIVGTELGAALTSLFGITESNFDNLAALVIFCNLSSLAPLLGIGWLDEIPEKRASPDDDNRQGYTDLSVDFTEDAQRILAAELTQDRQER